MVEAKEFLISLLEELKETLNLIGEEEYKNIYPPFTSSIGSHIRHILDHIRTFMEGIENKEPILYDERIRNTPIEYKIFSGKEAITEIINQLKSINIANTKITIQVLIYPDKMAKTIDSNPLRELHFLISHTIHHNAIIYSILQYMGKTPPKFFGFAPSTIRHLQK